MNFEKKIIGEIKNIKIYSEIPNTHKWNKVISDFNIGSGEKTNKKNKCFGISNASIDKNNRIYIELVESNGSLTEIILRSDNMKVIDSRW